MFINDEGAAAFTSVAGSDRRQWKFLPSSVCSEADIPLQLLTLIAIRYQFRLREPATDVRIDL